MKNKIFEHLQFLYGTAEANVLLPQLQSRLQSFRQRYPSLSSDDTQQPRFSQKDVILITYGDIVQQDGQEPLQVQRRFLKENVGDIISTIHLLPFFPYSSDDGFSVIDYQKVAPELGSWNDVHKLGKNFRLMFDAVINHISAESNWFKGYLGGDSKYKDYFFEVSPDFDTSQVFRPRALPILTAFQTATGKKRVWTTFSQDQIDLNYRSPELLLEIIDILLLYVANGADFIRLDAVAFLWKESGTNCVHLPQTHHIIQLIRAVLDVIAPRVSIITETNVPHQENISYFGDGYNEAQMVYNFALPPLTLQAFHSGSAETLSKWAATLTTPSNQTAFFNFLASHDGIGLMPVRGYLSEEEVTFMVNRIKALGGYVSYKNNSDGSQTAYEMNINYLDSLGDPESPDEDTTLTAQRFLASQAIMLALRGVPGIYFHSLLGSRSWKPGVEQTGRYRTINRQKLQYSRLTQELSDSNSLRLLVLNGFKRLLKIRRSNLAFHPQGGQQILAIHPAVFALLRTSPNGEFHVLCLHNVANRVVELSIDLKKLPMTSVNSLKDILNNREIHAINSQLSLKLAPYQVSWLQANSI